MKRTLFVLTSAFSAAIFASRYLISTEYLPYLAAACIFVCAAAFLPVSRKALKGLFPYLCCVLISFALGLLWRVGWDFIFLSRVSELDNTVQMVEAEVQSYAQPTDYGYTYIVRTAQPDTSGLTGVLYTGFEEGSYVPADMLSFYAHVKSPPPGSGWDNMGSQRARGIYYRLTPRSTIRLEGKKEVPQFFYPAVWSEKVTWVMDSSLSKDEAALLKGLVLGDQSDLSDSVRTELSEAGISHILSVSGMHVVFLSGLFISLFGNKRRTIIFAIPALFLFAMLTGFVPSVTRAVIMQSMLMLGHLFKRETDPLTSLSLAMFIILAVNPHAAGSAGLQLSFAASLGITLFSGRISDALYRLMPEKKRRFGKLKAFIISSVASTSGVMVFTLPLSAWYFRSVSLLAVVSNVLTLWDVSIAFLGGIFVSIISMAIPSAGILFILLRPFLAWLHIVSSAIAKIPYATIKLDDVYKTAWFVYAYSVILMYILYYFYKNRLRSPDKINQKTSRMMNGALPILTCTGVLAVVLLFSSFDRQRYDASLSVLDVGQGACAVFHAGDRVFMIDCGGNAAENAGVTASNYLKGKGRTSIDMLILTHLHGDHVNGVTTLLELIDVGMIVFYDGGQSEETLKEQILAAAEKAGVNCYNAISDMRVTLDAGYVELYAPPEKADEENEACLSVVCTFGNFSAIITGDLGGVSELDLIAGRELPDVDVYIAGHHGSKNSSNMPLLSRIKPETVIISVGKNSFGHPSDEAIERFNEIGAEVFRTDLSGTVEARKRQK